MVQAFTEFEAVESIKESCSVVLKISEIADSVTESKDILPQKVKPKALSMACSQFSIILSSGLPIVRAVELIAEQTTDKVLKKILTEVAVDVAGGQGLAHSFEKHQKLLPTAFIETIRAGEESGTLENSFKKLFKYYDKSLKIKGKVKSALMYPMFTVCVAVIVVIIIMTVAVPMFTDQFSSMGVELPGVTKALIAMSNFFTDYWLYLLITVAVLVIGLKIWTKTEKGRLAYAKFVLRMPLFGSLATMKAASQFSATMSTLLGAGLTMVQALSACAKIMDNYAVGLSLQTAASNIEEGKRLGDSIGRAGLLPKLLVEMASVGEETGELESTLDVIGDFYDNEVSTKTQRLLSLLEPIIVVVLAGFVVFVLLSVYLPMFGMYDSVM